MYTDYKLIYKMSNGTDEKFAVSLLLELFLKDRNKKVSEFYRECEALLQDENALSKEERLIIQGVGREKIYSYTRKDYPRTPNTTTIFSFLTALRKIFSDETINFEDIVAPLEKRNAENEIRIVKGYLEQNKYQDAIEEIDRLLPNDTTEIKKNDIIKHVPTRVYLALERGHAYYSIGQLNAARKAYKFCLDNADEYREWYTIIKSKVGIARVYLRKAQYKGALSKAEEALDNLGKFLSDGKIGLTEKTLILEAEVRRVIGDILIRIGFEAEVVFQWYALALKSIERVASKEASNVRGHIENNRGIALRQDNRCIDEAIKSHDKALREFKLFGDSRNVAHGRIRLAMALHRKSIFAHDREYEGLVKECLRLLSRARSTFGDIGERRGIAMTWYTEGLIHRHSRSKDDKDANIRLAIEKLEQALIYYRGLDDGQEQQENVYLRGEFYALVGLANCYTLWSRYKADPERFQGFEREKLRYRDLREAEEILKRAENIIYKSTKEPLKERKSKILDFRGEQYFNVSYSKVFIESARVEMSLLSKGMGSEDRLKRYLEEARSFGLLALIVATGGRQGIDDRKGILKEMLDASSVEEVDDEKYILDKYVLGYKSDPEFQAQALLSIARVYLYSFVYDLRLSGKNEKERKDHLNFSRKYFTEAGAMFEKNNNFFGRGVSYVGLAETFIEEENRVLGRDTHSPNKKFKGEYSLGTLRRVIDYYLLARESFKCVSRYGRLKSIADKLKELGIQNEKNTKNIIRILKSLGQTSMLKDIKD